MALVACRTCRRVFINSVEGETTCPECLAKLQELYPVVRNFLRDNEKNSYTVYELSKILNIEAKHIEGLIALGWIGASGLRHKQKVQGDGHRKKGGSSRT